MERETTDSSRQLKGKNRREHMMHHDPKEAIVEFLSHPPHPYAKVMQEDGLIAKAATILFLKDSGVVHHQLHAVRFESETGQQQDCFCLVHQNESGLWQSGDIAFSGEGKRAEKETSHPWVVFSGGGRDPWSAGGHVIDNGFE